MKETGKTAYRRIVVDLLLSLDKRHVAVAPARRSTRRSRPTFTSLRADRSRHARLPAHGIAPAARRRPLGRSPADCPSRCRGHAVHLCRLAHPVPARELRGPARGRVRSGDGLLGVPPGVVARGAHGVGWAPGLAQSLFQVGGNVGLGARARWRAAIIVVRWGRQGWAPSRCSRWSPPPSCRASGSGTGVMACGGRQPRGARASVAPARRSPGRVSGIDRRPPGAHLLEVRLPGGVHQLLHVLSHASVRRLGAQTRRSTSLLSSRPSAVGTLAGGPLGDRLGRKPVIWFSILGALPFTLALPYADLFWTRVLSVLDRLRPRVRVSGDRGLRAGAHPRPGGLVAGLFFGLSFGAAGLGAALLGRLADATSIEHVYHVVAFLPAIGVLAALLPDLRGGSTPARGEDGAQVSGA